MKHYHVHITGDRVRHVGALATTYEMARQEADVEVNSGHSVEGIISCSDERCYTPRQANA